MAKLIEVKDKQGLAYMFHCPGCEMYHLIPVKYESGHDKRNGKAKPTWAFNGDQAKPSFKPTFMVEWVGSEPPQRCHSIVRDGELIFLVDTTHKLSGSRVKMRDE